MRNFFFERTLECRGGDGCPDYACRTLVGRAMDDQQATYMSTSKCVIGVNVCPSHAWRLESESHMLPQEGIGVALCARFNDSLDQRSHIGRGKRQHAVTARVQRLRSCVDNDDGHKD
nr:hypothetical protein [Pandoravirus massiliensis]